MVEAVGRMKRVTAVAAAAIRGTTVEPITKRWVGKDPKETSYNYQIFLHSMTKDGDESISPFKPIKDNLCLLKAIAFPLKVRMTPNSD